MFQICYKCLVSENCFSDNSNDGIVGNCEVPPNNGCYKAIFGKIFLVFLKMNLEIQKKISNTLDFRV